MAYARKLMALGYHSPDSFDINDEKQVRNLVVWLEDKKIRFYDSADRDALRDIESQYWIGALKKYLGDLKCPIDNMSNKGGVLNWLISHAVQIEYEENGSKYNAECSTKTRTTIDTNSWLNTVDCNDTNLMKGIEMLRETLNMPKHPDHLILLQAIAKLVDERLVHGQQKEMKESTTYLALDDVALGFNIDDSAVKDAAKIVRLLQIHQLRDLQTRINQSIVAVQRLSANPKTDQSLGKVGR